MTNEVAKHGQRLARGCLDVAGLVLRVRRAADLSQRELAAALGIGQSTIARLETGRSDPRVGELERVLAVAGMRLAVVDAANEPVAPVPFDELRDHGGRRSPAHLDARPPHDPPWLRLAEPRYDRPEPGVWFHHRRRRDERRSELGIGAEHDHPTAHELRSHHARSQAERLEQARRRGLRDSIRLDDCVCIEACWHDGECAAECACACDA
ncbi:helix-turn-helix domain-containing protein [Agromyces sp. NPDC058064]|uniref:helix-turn-helix domain-containing protein n=1 Tax=Agromyces sp. NPDC058064 TaxID=3346322 RepID=UPI0036DEC270